jgi:hypothetical protein
MPSRAGVVVVQQPRPRGRLVLLRLGRQFAVEQQIADLEKVAVLGELVDRVAAMQQHAGVAVDIGDAVDVKPGS